ncbi:MAG: magnesium transporter [Oscillospiraceae bacterium]|nr:magnesium transporter [Oscillospiraceae bacterium]
MTQDILKIMNENPVNPTKVHELTVKMNTVDIADAFELLSKEKIVGMFRLLPKSIAADVFSYIIPEKQQIIVEALTDTEAGRIIDELFVDDAVDFIEEMPANVVKHVLQTVNADKRKIINQLLQYPEDSAGTIMTTEYVDLRENHTVKEAFDYIRKTGVDKETIYTCYVIRFDKVLLGAVSAKTLMLADPSDKIGDIMDTHLILAQTTDDQEEVSALFTKYGLISLPVVDKEQRLVGIVTVDDIVQIIEEETTEDFEKMAAITPSEDPYMKTGVIKQSRNRIPWLMILMLTAIVTEAIISSYERAIMVVPVLGAFIPMLMDTAGNAGSQTSVLVIRGMALGEIRTGDILRVLWREIRVGVLCGLALGVVNFARVLITNSGNYMLSLTVTVSLIATVIIAKSVGATLPIIAKKLRLDPAVMASPVITSIADASALFIYFGIATLFLRI